MGRRVKDNRDALYLWGAGVYRELVDGRTWGQMIITLQDGKTTLVEKRLTEKPPTGANGGIQDG